MTVSYAQFIVENPEFSEIPQTMIEPRLLAFDAHYDGFGDFHDMAVYAVTALDLSEAVFGMPMSDDSTVQDRYKKRWTRILALCFRRGQISGGGLT
jgi:hypothetical protein